MPCMKLFANNQRALVYKHEGQQKFFAVELIERKDKIVFEMETDTIFEQVALDKEQTRELANRLLTWTEES